MARSSYVYIVLINTRPIAAFTVKHEMQSAITKWFGQRIPLNVFVKRTRDNGQMGVIEDITADVFGLKESE